jgi:hypothetical protein
VSSPHVPVPSHLRVDPEFENAVAFLRLIDPDLRLRKSAEAFNLYILERRCRRAPATNTPKGDHTHKHKKARAG